LSVTATASFAGSNSSYDAEVKKDIESFQSYFKKKFSIRARKMLSNI
jgi:hypothetical protein